MAYRHTPLTRGSSHHKRPLVSNHYTTNASISAQRSSTDLQDVRSAGRQASYHTFEVPASVDLPCGVIRVGHPDFIFGYLTPSIIVWIIYNSTQNFCREAF